MRRGISGYCVLVQALSGRFLCCLITQDMDNKNDKPQPAKPASPREERLKAALKANMAKRKAQARAKAAATGSKQKE